MKVLLIQRVVTHYRLDLFRKIYETLSKQGIDLKIICGESIRNTKYRNADRLPEFVKVVLKHPHFLEKYFVLYWNLYLILKSEDPDLVISEGGANTVNNVILNLFSKMERVPYIIWDLGKFVRLREEMPRLLEKIYALLYKGIILSSKSIITYNNAGAKYFQETFHLPRRKIHILFNTINDAEIFKSKGKLSPNRKFEEFSKRFSKILIYVGSIDEYKNLDLLSKIQGLLNDEFGFLIVGDGSYREALKKNMKSETTFFAGHVSNLNELAYFYSKSNVFLLPGLGGLAINQSLAFGVPVICSEADGSEFDLIIEDVTGSIQPKNNAVEWVKKISFFCNLGRKCFEKNCAEHIANNFSLDKAVGNFLHAIKSGN